MLIPFVHLVRRNASDPPKRLSVAIDPEAIARVEETDTPGESLLYVDGGDKPYRVTATVEEVVGVVCCFSEPEEDEPCEPETYATA